MKKLISLGMIMAMLLCSFSISFAADVTTPAEDEISPAYVTTNSIYSGVTMSGSTAKFYVKVLPHSTTSISYINATLKLVNSNGTVLKTVSDRVNLSGVTFDFASTKSSVARGSYHTEYTLKIYKSGRLVETIKGKSGVTKY